MSTNATFSRRALAAAAVTALLTIGCATEPEAPAEAGDDFGVVEAELSGKCESGLVGTGKGGACFAPSQLKSDAAKACTAKGLKLSGMKFNKPCGKGGYQSGHYQCCAPPESTQPKCTKIVLGGPKQCLGDAEWKGIASKVCGGKGLGVGAIALELPCGDGAHGRALVSCCPAEAPEQCEVAVVGGGAVCEGPGVWAKSAAKLCAAKGKVVAASSFGTVCGEEKYTSIKVKCCGSAPPPPGAAASQCVKALVKAPNGCQSEAEWKSAMSEACATKALVLTSLAMGSACAGGGFSTATSECCSQP